MLRARANLHDGAALDELAAGPPIYKVYIIKLGRYRFQ